MTDTIIIVGAGAAGLMAARELSAKNKKVILLEGNNRLGGRINTIQPEGFSQPIEEGAEFVHGTLPVTLELLQEAGIHWHAVTGKMETFRNGRFMEQEEFTLNWDELIAKMEELSTDMTLADFLRKYFDGDQHADLRRSVKRFAEGFDLADIEKASVFTIRREWANEEPQQYRIPGGYGQLVRYLEQQSRAKGCQVEMDCIVKNIRWKKGEVTVNCANGKTFTGNKVIVAVPMGVLQAKTSHPTCLQFEPAIPDYLEAMQEVGFGTVIKILMEFREPFWEKTINKLGFVLSSEPVPTWWTQLPDETPLLTGWLGGRQTGENYSNQQKDYTEVKRGALQSLSTIFGKEIQELEKLLVACHIANWYDDAFSLGAYSYYTMKTEEAQRLLNTPLEDTVYFAGEGVYDGAWGGTVEAALESGKAVADSIR